MLVIGLFIFPISSWFCLGRLCLSKNFSQVVPAWELCPNFIGILLLVVVSYDPLYLRRKWQPTPVFLPGESHRQRSLVGHSQGVVKSRTEHRCNQCKQQSNHLILIGPSIYPELTEWETLRVWLGCFNKHFRWFCYSLKFEKHCWKQCNNSPPIYRDTIQWAFHCLALCSQQNLSSSYHADII